MNNSVSLFAQELEVTIASGNYNDYNISCFGLRDGNIDVTVTGGTPPYNYKWTNGASTQDLHDVASGYYKVLVSDAVGNNTFSEITLTEPEAMGTEMMLSGYPNGYNISCNSCFNGHILIQTFGGVGPYSYSWDDGPATQDRFNLGRGTYTVNIIDANQCLLIPERIQITEPDRSDWTQFGNTGSDPSLHFIGTTDNKDLKIKTNNTERLLIKANGDIKLNGLTPGMLHLDQNNVFQSSNEALSAPCAGTISTWPRWSANSNALLYSCPIFNVSIGSYTIPNNVKFKVEGNSFLNGSVYIGIDPNAAVGGATYKLLVDGKLGAKEIYCSLGNPWPDYVFENDYELLSLNSLRRYVSKNKHLPGVPSAKELESEGANMMELMSKAYEKIEELHLYIFELEERLRKVEEVNN